MKRFVSPLFLFRFALTHLRQCSSEGNQKVRKNLDFIQKRKTILWSIFIFIWNRENTTNMSVAFYKTFIMVFVQMSVDDVFLIFWRIAGFPSVGQNPYFYPSSGQPNLPLFDWVPFSRSSQLFSFSDLLCRFAYFGARRRFFAFPPSIELNSFRKKFLFLKIILYLKYIWLYRC